MALSSEYIRGLGLGVAAVTDVAGSEQFAVLLGESLVVSVETIYADYSGMVVVTSTAITNATF